MSKWCRDFVKTLFIRLCAKFLPMRFSVIIVTSEVLNVILLMVNNFDIKENMAIFVLLYTQASNKIKVGECLQGSVNFSDKRTIFLKKIQLQHINLLSCFLKLSSHWKLLLVNQYSDLRLCDMNLTTLKVDARANDEVWLR